MFLSDKISDLMARYRRPKNPVSNDSKDQDVSFKHNNLKRSLLFGGIGITLITIFVLFSQLQSNQVIQPSVTKRFNHNWHTAKSTWQPNALSDNQLREVARLVQQVDVVPIFNPFMIP
uniref:Uncharacterized protein n=1 Tax=Ciona savignyi TaxID=51511 RepID=H2ZMW7_CIOSA